MIFKKMSYASKLFIGAILVVLVIFLVGAYIESQIPEKQIFVGIA